MLRASQAVRAGAKCAIPTPMLHPPHSRLVSVQLVRDNSKKRKNATGHRKPLPQKWGARRAAEGAGSILMPPTLVKKRGGPKFGKLADKLAQIKAAKEKQELSSSDPEERAQRQLLNSIQSPMISAEDFTTRRHAFLKQNKPVAYVDPETKSYVEKTRSDALSGRYVAKSSLDNLYKLDNAQKSRKGHKPSLVYNEKGAALSRLISDFLESHNKRAKLQQINMRVRVGTLQNRMQRMVEDEVQFQIEQQKIYLAKLESIQSRAEGEEELSEEDQLLLESLKAEYGVEDTPLKAVLTQIGDSMAKYSFQFLKMDLQHLILSNDSDTINILNPNEDWRLQQLKIGKFMARNQGTFLPQATVCDGTRLYIQCSQDIVIVPFTKISERQLSVLFRNALSAEFERVRNDYDLSEEEAITQLQAIFDSGENYLAHFPPKPKGKAVKEDEFEFFRLEEATKDIHYKYEKFAPAETGLPDEAESIKHSLRSKESTFEQVEKYLNQLKPPTDVVYTQRWTALAEKIDKSVLAEDLRKYIKDAFKKNKIPFPQERLVKQELIDLLRTQVWKVTLTDSIKNLHISTETFSLNDTEKLLLFKYHFELVRLWASRGADVSFSGENELEVKGTTKSQDLVSVTLSQFKKRISQARLDLSSSDLSLMTPELWKTLETTTETSIDFSDSSDIQVSYLGNADKAVSLLKRYIESMKPHSRFSQSVIFQTNPESIQKSAFYPRSVSHEQPWYKRATKSWSRWREIHGSEFVINTEQPVLSLVTSTGVKKLPYMPLQNLISETLQKQLSNLPSSTITQDEEQCVVEETRDEKTVRQANIAGVSAPYDPTANNGTQEGYEKIAIEAVLGHLVHANKSTSDGKGCLDITNIDPVSDLHFSGSIPFVNEKLQSMFPKSRHAAQDRFRVVLSCIPVSGNAPPISIEAVTLQKNESWAQYAPPSIYAVTRQTNLVVSLPSTNSDIMFVAKAKHKLYPSKEMLETWKRFSQDFNRQVDHPPRFEINVNGKNVTYKCVSVVYTRHDEYPIVNYQEASSGVILHRNTLGGDLSGVRNDVSMGMVYRDYEEGRELEEGEEEHPQEVSDKLMYEFVGNSLKFMDSLDAESVPL